MRHLALALVVIAVLGAAGIAVAADPETAWPSAAPEGATSDEHAGHDMHAGEEMAPRPDEMLDSDAVHTHAHARDYEQLWSQASPEERDAATALVAATKAALADYEEYSTAEAAGYHPNANGGTNTTHHPNPAHMRDGRVLDPEVPESLVYWTARDGRKVLVGAVYKTRRGEAAPAPGGALTSWHTHVGDRKCYPALDPTCPQNTGKMLHVFFFEGVRDPFTENMVAAAGSRQAFAAAMRTSLRR
jgi:hypothetical protein